jgi:uncharacterized protein (TIGR02118 family)
MAVDGTAHADGPIKMIIAFRRRTDMTFERFSDYWAEHHAPLVQEVAEVLGVRVYNQCRSVAVAQSLSVAAADEEAGEFDGYAELWWESEASMKAAMSTRGPGGARAPARRRAQLPRSRYAALRDDRPRAGRHPALSPCRPGRARRVAGPARHHPARPRYGPAFGTGPASAR